jgi:amino acid transporter
LPWALARTQRVHDSPYIASFLQTAIAAAVVLGFYLAGLDPYTQMFLWLLSLGGLGLMVLLAATAVGSIIFFRRHEFERSLWVSTIAPGIASIGLIVEVVLLVTNWDVQVGSTGGFVAYLPLLLIVPIAVGLFGGKTLRPKEWKVEESAW